MKLFFKVLCLFILISITGCATSSQYSEDIQKSWQGRSINELDKRIGGTVKKGFDKNGQKFYSWSGTSYINGNGQLVKRDCQLRATVDDQENIIKLENHSQFGITSEVCKKSESYNLRMTDTDLETQKKNHRPTSKCNTIFGDYSLICDVTRLAR